MGAEQVSSCRVDFSVSVEKMKNLVCAEWKCLGAEQIVGAEKSSGAEQWKYNSCWALVKFSRYWVNP